MAAVTHTAEPRTTGRETESQKTKERGIGPGECHMPRHGKYRMQEAFSYAGPATLRMHLRLARDDSTVDERTSSGGKCAREPKLIARVTSEIEARRIAETDAHGKPRSAHPIVRRRLHPRSCVTATTRGVATSSPHAATRVRPRGGGVVPKGSRTGDMAKPRQFVMGRAGAGELYHNRDLRTYAAGQRVGGSAGVGRQRCT
ncbi:hypothetical protein FB451DRAFT_1187896 [Mycena latifolia]|nr:hypothetical protein FB451DRAFT_1187896 [Mycena latifolia]